MNYCDQCGANLKSMFEFHENQPMLFYCLKCKAPRTVVAAQHKHRTDFAGANCPVCGQKMSTYEANPSG
jgi:transcription elongation factor Elf1